MIYFATKKETALVRSFFDDVQKLWQAEDMAKKAMKNRYVATLGAHRVHELIVRSATTSDNSYSETRVRISKQIEEVGRLAKKYGVKHVMSIIPPADIGGCTTGVDVFDAIVSVPLYGAITRPMIADALNRVLGACERQLAKDTSRVKNPFYWFLELLKFSLQLPFLIVSATGFNVSKIEDQLLGKIVKVGFLLLLVYILLQLGFSKEDLLKFLPLAN